MIYDLDYFWASQDNYLKRYIPLWPEYIDPKDKIYQEKQSIMVKNFELSEILNTINLTVMNEAI